MGIKEKLAVAVNLLRVTATLVMVIATGALAYYGIQIARARSEIERLQAAARPPPGPIVNTSLATRVLPAAREQHDAPKRWFVAVDLALHNSGSEAARLDLQRAKGMTFGLSKVLNVRSDGSVEYGPETKLDFEKGTTPAAGTADASAADAAGGGSRLLAAGDRTTQQAIAAVTEPGMYLVMFRPPLAPGEEPTSWRTSDAAAYVAVQ